MNPTTKQPRYRLNFKGAGYSAPNAENPTGIRVQATGYIIVDGVRPKSGFNVHSLKLSAAKRYSWNKPDALGSQAIARITPATQRSGSENNYNPSAIRYQPSAINPMPTTATKPNPYAFLDTLLAQKAKTLVASFFGIPITALEGRSRRQELNWPRFLCIYLIRENTILSTAKIGALFGRDHATIIHACYAVQVRAQCEKPAAAQLAQLETKFANLL